MIVLIILEKIFSKIKMGSRTSSHSNQTDSDHITLCTYIENITI